MPFREAHEVIGKLVAEAANTGTPLNKLPVATLLDASPAFGDDVAEVFDLSAALAARKAAGAPSAINVCARLDHWRATLQ